MFFHEYYLILLYKYLPAIYILQTVCKIKEVHFLLDLYCSMAKLVLYCCTVMNLFRRKPDTFSGNLLKLILR